MNKINLLHLSFGLVILFSSTNVLSMYAIASSAKKTMGKRAIASTSEQYLVPGPVRNCFQTYVPAGSKEADSYHEDFKKQQREIDKREAYFENLPNRGFASERERARYVELSYRKGVFSLSPAERQLFLDLDKTRRDGVHLADKDLRQWQRLYYAMKNELSESEIDEWEELHATAQEVASKY